MAFINPKYEIIFDDVYATPDGTNTVYRAQIYKDGYSSATVYPLTASNSPFIIETIDTEGNAYTPVLATVEPTGTIYVSRSYICCFIVFINPYI